MAYFFQLYQLLYTICALEINECALFAFQIHSKYLEVCELRGNITQLQSQIDQLTEKASNSSAHSMTLFNELTQLDASNEFTMLLDSPQAQVRLYVFNSLPVGTSFVFC